MDIYKVIKQKACDPDFQAKNKLDSLVKMSELLSQCVNLETDTIFNALKTREDKGTTGVENHIAIPHSKIPGLTEFVMGILISKRGIDFESIDNKKSKIIFVVIGPEKPEEHLQILAEISRISRNKHARRELINATSRIGLKETFVRFASGSQHNQKKEKLKLYIVVCNELQYLDDILEIFVGKGIHGVNVIESSGMKNYLSSIPLFSDFMNFLEERRDRSKTRMTLVPENQVEKITQNIEEIMGDLDTHTGALVMALDVPYMKGSLEI